MTRNKKNIEKFQEALSSNTEFLNEDNFEDKVLFGEDKRSVEDFIDKIIYRKFKILSAYQKKDTQELINEALNHYLRLKKLYLDEAIKELTKED